MPTMGIFRPLSYQAPASACPLLAWCCVPGLLLREAIEDMECTGGEVEFVIRRNPTQFSLQSIKQQSLEVRIAVLGSSATRGQQKAQADNCCSLQAGLSRQRGTPRLP